MNARAVLVFGEVKGAARSSIEQAHLGAELQPTFVATAEQAQLALDQQVWRALVVDLTTPGAARFCHEARGRRALSNVPLIGLTPSLSDVSYTNALRLGADDLVALGSDESLRVRLAATPSHVAAAPTTRGDAVIADPDAGQCDVIGRVLSNAGFNVKFAVDAVSARFFALKTAPELIVLNADLVDPRALIEESRASGRKARFIVIAQRKNVEPLSARLEALGQVAVMGSHSSPESVLFYENVLNPTPEARRGELRALYGTMVLFRPVGDVRDECGFSYSVSASGLYVRTLLPPPSRNVWLELTPAGQNRRVRLSARVVWSRAFGSSGSEIVPPGFGLQVIDGLGEDLELWTLAFQSLSPLSVGPTVASPLPPKVPFPTGPTLSPPTLQHGSRLPGLPSRLGSRVPLASAGSYLPAASPSSIAPMPVLSSAPPVANRDAAERSLGRSQRLPSPTSNDDRGRTVLGMGSLTEAPSGAVASKLETQAALPAATAKGHQRKPAHSLELSQLLADAGLLDLPETVDVKHLDSAALPSPGPERSDTLPAVALRSSTPTNVKPSTVTLLGTTAPRHTPTEPPRSGSASDRATVDLSSNDLESMPPGRPSSPSNLPTFPPGSDAASVSEVLDRLFEPGAGVGSGARIDLSARTDHSASMLEANHHLHSEAAVAYPSASDVNLTETLSGSASPNAPTSELSPAPPETALRVADSKPAPTSSRIPRRHPQKPWLYLSAALTMGTMAVATPFALRALNLAPHISAAMPELESFRRDKGEPSPAANDVAVNNAAHNKRAANSTPITDVSPAPFAGVETNMGLGALDAPAVSREVAIRPPLAAPVPSSGELVKQPTIAVVAAPLLPTSAGQAAVAAPPEAESLPPNEPALIIRQAPDDALFLPADMAYLHVISPLERAFVFVHGVQYGTTNQWLRTKCGQRFVRLGTAPGSWLSDGLPTHIRCRAINVLRLPGSRPQR